MLALSNISASYDGSRILRDVSLNVAPGQVVCLMGRNGVGKTTTLKAITGLFQLDSGAVRLGDTELTGLKPDGRARSGIGFVPHPLLRAPSTCRGSAGRAGTNPVAERSVRRRNSA